MQSLMVAPKFVPKPQIAFLSCLHLSVQYHHLPICSGHSLGILPSFSYRLAQLFNNPDSSNSKLYSQSDSLHNSNTYHHGPKAPITSIWMAAHLLSLSASTLHSPEKLGIYFKWLCHSYHAIFSV